MTTLRARELAGSNSPLQQAIRAHQAGQLGAAEAAYRLILAENPAQQDALHLLGMLASDRGDAQGALPLIDAALAAEPDRVAFHNTRAQALLRLGRPREAEASYRTAWALHPHQAEIANNLACLLRDRGDATGAVKWFRRASELAPGSAEIACNLATALAAEGAAEASLAAFQQALALSPASADIHHKFADLQQTLGRFEAAAHSYRTALRLRPDQAASHNNLGVALQSLGDAEAARRCFETALEHDPHCADAHYNLGCLLLLDNRLDAARGCHERAVAVAPLHGRALWARCMVELPILYDTPQQVAVQRALYGEQLRRLAEAAADPGVAAALAATAGSSQPFFLAYQGECDRDLQSVYGTLLARLLRREPPGRAAVAPGPGEPIRVGIVSGYFCEHTIWRLMLKGWLGQFDRRRFRVLAYHTGAAEDAQTAVARALADRFTTGRGPDIRAAILADRPHVLLYPELGMDQTAARLAAERLAPVQCVAWGHPETSGLPTIDVFLSSALMEPDGAEVHYTERLVTLPNLGIHYTPDEAVATACTRAELGLRDDAVVFWCGQALYKYLPQDDDVFARLAVELPCCQFLFIAFARSRAVTEQFRTRLRRAFAARGLDADHHCVFLDPMPQARFLGTVRVADIVLDSLGWSGGKSTLDALGEDPVIVTQAGALMRGRHTAAILARIGVTETVAATTDDYVAIALRLARDPSERAAVRARMAAVKHLAYADPAPIRALEALLVDAVATSHAG
jgi:predicted O-linked N-acetylglucosamine transferase (SPINDLY family)